jgi:hypothetical protein
VGAGRIMTQALYAHMNNKTIKKRKKVLSNVFNLKILISELLSFVSIKLEKLITFFLYINSNIEKREKASPYHGCVPLYSNLF